MAAHPGTPSATPPDGGRIGCFPGSFDPPTVAHLAVAEAALAAGGLVRVDLVVSRVALGKEHLDERSVERRLAVLDAVAATRPWLGVAVREERLIAELAEGYDAVVLGADKWRQVLDPAWYGGSGPRRDAAVRGLPLVLVAPRGDDELIDASGAAAPGAVGGPRVVVLDLDPAHRHVSATAVRAGHPDGDGWAVPEAAAPPR